MSAVMIDTVRNMVGNKLANIILLPVEHLRMDQKFDDFGIDSMRAAELRAYISRALKVDIPATTFLDDSTTVNSLSEMVVERLKSK